MTEPAHEDGQSAKPDAAQLNSAQADAPPGPSLLALLQALFADAKILIEAESGYVRALAAFVLGRAKIIAILVVLAMFFLFFALMAGIVGLLLALAPLIGAWLAVAVVTGVLLVLGASCALIAWRCVRHMIRVLTGTARPRS